MRKKQLLDSKVLKAKTKKPLHLPSVFLWISGSVGAANRIPNRTFHRDDVPRLPTADYKGGNNLPAEQQDRPWGYEKNVVIKKNYQLALKKIEKHC